jgi:integrase
MDRSGDDLAYLSDLAQEYLEYRRATKAANTVRTDKQALDKLKASVGNVPITVVDASEIDHLTAIMYDEEFETSTIRLTLDKLSAFFKWAETRGHIPHGTNPVGSRRDIKIHKKNRPVLTVEQFHQAIEAAPSERDRFVIATGLFTMLRQSEIVALKVKDLDLAEGKLSVKIFKSYDQDRLPISPDYRQHIIRWLAHYQKECGPLQPDWYLCCSQQVNGGFHQFKLAPTKPITRSHDIVRRAFARMGIQADRIGLHILRRSAAQEILRQGIENGHDGTMRRIQTILHHKSITTTEKYLDLDVDRAERDRYYQDNAMFPAMSKQTKDNTLRLVQ